MTDRDPPDGNVAGDPIFPDPNADPGEEPYDERAPVASDAFLRAHNFGHGLFEYGEAWA